MKTALDVIAEAMDEERMMYGADRENAAQILAALTAAGYVIVPQEATPEIIAAGNWVHDSEGAECWRQMVSAASQ